MPEQKAQITFDEFSKLDLRLATITKAEEIPGADKLLKLTLDVGELGERVICAGIKEFFTGEQITGAQIIIVANLAPRKMRGIDSHGMLLAASNADHSQLRLLIPSIKIVPADGESMKELRLPAGSVVG